VECKSALQVLADSWYQDGIVSSRLFTIAGIEVVTHALEQDRQRTALGDILASAKGFTDTSDQDRYDDCEMAISRVVREIRSVANAWKVRMMRILLC
jgi:centromere/kinetochore protein ZW10